MINHQEAIKRMESVREYLCAGNPIWNVDEMREVFDMAISALQAQEAKTQLSAEGTTSDLISRQEAIEVADAVWCVTGDVNVAKVWDQLKNLPSAEPEIVRCKDCKFYTAYDYTGKLMCKRIGKGMILPKLEDYCSYAERIADERSD